MDFKVVYQNGNSIVVNPIDNPDLCYFLSLFIGKHSESLISDIDYILQMDN